MAVQPRPADRRRGHGALPACRGRQAGCRGRPVDRRLPCRGVRGCAGLCRCAQCWWRCAAS
ncbi:hypothetical protein ACU4GD_44425 [Cupriavidus basilensis]